VWLTANGERGRVFCACAQNLPASAKLNKNCCSRACLLRMFIRCRKMFSERRVQELYTAPLSRPLTKFTCTDWPVNCCWSSPAQWFLVPSPTGITTLFYCLTALRSFRIPDLHWFLSSSPNTCAHTATICGPEQSADHRFQNSVAVKITNKCRVICKPKICTKVTD
jgi:hypothetical protein